MTKTTVPLEEMGDLHRVEDESKAQGLPKQEKVFSIAKRVRSRFTNLPDPTHPPLGFVPSRGFDVVFPLEMVWAVFDQIREVFLNPALIGGILASPPKSRTYEDVQGYSE